MYAAVCTTSSFGVHKQIVHTRIPDWKHSSGNGVWSMEDALHRVALIDTPKFFCFLNIIPGAWLLQLLKHEFNYLDKNELSQRIKSRATPMMNKKQVTNLVLYFIKQYE